MSEIRRKEPTHIVEIFVAGDIHDARRMCRQFCLETGLCVTVEPTEFIYVGGSELGARIGLTNYPRFPSSPELLWKTAEHLARRLLVALSQRSVLVRSPSDTLWISMGPDE